MTARALSSYIFTSKYANHVNNLRRRESWTESGDRVFGMHEKKYAAILPKIQPYLEEARTAFDDMLALGSQRILQFGGEPVLKKEARAFNCTVSFVDRVRVFQEAFWLLLCGCGVGFSVQWHHVTNLPPLKRPSASSTIKPFVIPDTIEGWADALGVLLSSYFDSDDTPFPEYRDCIVTFNYSQIRAKGARLSSGNGKAPGPDPLRQSLEKVRDLLDRVCGAHGQGAHGEPHGTAAMARDLYRARKLQPIDAYDIIMHASDAVLSGGVRRSASICIFSADDAAMARAKTGDWGRENPQRGRSNNSALLLRKSTSQEDFKKLVDLSRQWGEPGFFWADSTECIPNPCVEIGMWPVDVETGKTGWQFCNLSLINMAKVRSSGDFYRAARAAAIMGTLQAGYTSFAYLGEVSERITRREALLGVSMTGMMEAPSLAFDPDVLKRMARVVLDTNAEVAAILGINVAARATCVKPEGTSSCLLETCSGIHPHHAPRYFRRVQANDNEPPALFFRDRNPFAVERSMWSRDKSDIVLTFCVEAPEGSILSKDMSALDLLQRVKLVKENWVDEGKRVDSCTQPWLSHNVSNTVYVGDDEWDDVAKFIFDHRQTFAGVSLLKREGDLDYPQAPFVEVMTDKQLIDVYGPVIVAGAREVLSSLPRAFDDLWVACDTAEDCRLGIGIDLDAPVGENPHDKIDNAIGRKAEMREWVGRHLLFAQTFFEGSVVKASHALKNVANYERWAELTARIVDVDYTEMIETEDNTAFEQQAACAGGACSIV